MTTVNEARFTITGTASEDANGNRGYDGENGETLSITLEVDPSPALAVTYSVYDSADTTSPLASKDAPAITWNENALEAITPSDVNDIVTIDLPAAGVHSYLIRCLAVTPGGSKIFERLVAIRTAGENTARKRVPAESGQYTARGVSEDQNELLDKLTLNVNDQTGTTYTLALTDAEGYVRCANAAAITLTVPAEADVAFPIGTQILLQQLGAGVLSIVPDGGVTINGYASGATVSDQYKGAVLIKAGSDEWDLYGSIEAI